MIKRIIKKKKTNWRYAIIDKENKLSLADTFVPLQNEDWEKYETKKGVISFKHPVHSVRTEKKARKIIEYFKEEINNCPKLSIVKFYDLTKVITFEYYEVKEV